MEVNTILYYLICGIIIAVAIAILLREVRIESTARFYVRVKKRMQEIENEKEEK